MGADGEQIPAASGSDRASTDFNGPSLTCERYVSAGQRAPRDLVHTEEVTGSIPVSPTVERPGQRLREELPARPFDGVMPR
jgi:hypothetical protein